MFENNKFTIVAEDGREVECEILFTFDNKENGKSYVVYVDGTTDENGVVRVYASVYDPTGENTRLMPIETEEEWEMIEELLASMEDGIGEGFVCKPIHTAVTRFQHFLCNAFPAFGQVFFFVRFGIVEMLSRIENVFVSI